MNTDLPPIQTQNPLMMLMKQILEGIAAGQISSVGIIVVQTNGMTSANYVGNQRADLNVGADLLKGSILRDMTQPQKVSPIIRATMA